MERISLLFRREPESEPGGPALNRRQKQMVHLILLVLAIIFLLPLLWLTLTALKPVEQVMTIPPSFIPKAYFAPVNGRRTRVIVDPEPVGRPSVLVAYSGSQNQPVTILLPENAVKNNRADILITAAGVTEKKSVPVTILQNIPADWVRVTEKVEGHSTVSPRVAWVPPGQIESSTRWEFRNFRNAVKAIPFFLYLENTVVVCTLSVIGTLFASALTAYGFTCVKWPGRDLFFIVTLATLMMPASVTVIPLYAVFKQLGWIGTTLPLWAPACFGSAFNIFLLRQFFLTIPRDLIEAARMDGCSHWQIFTRVVLPLSRPALGVVALLQFLISWNDFLGPLIFLTDQRTYTLALGLQFYQSRSGGTDWHLLMAASLLFMLPIVILFLAVQKTFIRGIAAAGMK